MKWKRQEQEQPGDYFFSGQFVVTRGVDAALTKAEIMLIYWEVQQLVEEHDGMDYLQSYVHQDTGEKLFFIDQLSKSMLESGDYDPEHNLCTLMLAEEY